MGKRRERIDMTGLVFGELTVLSFSHLDKNKGAHWLARCSCGVEKTVNGYDVRSGKILSCGHLKASTGAKNQYKHGHARRGDKTPTYRCWRNMLARCYDPTCDRYENYGGRGIYVCDRWLHFVNFLADMGEKPIGLTLERNNVNGNYEPANCRWATWAEQRLNTTRSKSNANHSLQGR